MSGDLQSVTLVQAPSPHTGTRMVRHRDTPDPLDVDWATDELPVVLEVVIVDRADPDVAANRRIGIQDVAGSPWPYSTTWGEPMTPAEARRLAAMLERAADAVDGR